MKLAPLAITVAIYCSTSFQGYRTCSSPDGYRSTETQWQGLVIGQDNDGNRWTTSRCRDIDISTVKPPDR